MILMMHEKLHVIIFLIFRRLIPERLTPEGPGGIPVRTGHVEASQLHLLVLDAEEKTCLRKREQRFVAFKTLPQYAVQTLIVIIIVFLLEFVYRTLKIGRSSLTTHLFEQGCRMQFGRTVLHHSRHVGLEESSVLRWDRKTAEVFHSQCSFCFFCLETVMLSSYPARKLKLTSLPACKLSAYMHKILNALRNSNVMAWEVYKKYKTAQKGLL